MAPGRADQTRGRAGVDDVADALRDHDRIDGGDAVDHAADVDVDDAAPVLRRHVARVAGDEDAGVVEEIVDAAVLRGNVLENARESVRIADVEPHRRRRASGKGRDFTLRLLGVDVGKEDSPATTHELLSDGQADAGGTAGDDGCLRREGHGSA